MDSDPKHPGLEILSSRVLVNRGGGKPDQELISQDYLYIVKYTVHVPIMLIVLSTRVYDSITEAKKRYENILNWLQNPTLFFNYIKNFTKSHASVDCLEVVPLTMMIETTKGNILNDHFASVMTVKLAMMSYHIISLMLHPPPLTVL